MKTSTSRSAISIALLACIAGLSKPAMAGTQLVDGDGQHWPKGDRDAESKGVRSAPEYGEEEATELGRIEVTGTRIKGGSTPSPVITIGAERIREEGFTDLGEVIRSIPQNFSGGQNPGVVTGATGGGSNNQNITGGSGANLRGLGQDATLTLLNGHRLSYGGYVQAVDISAIPVEAVERVEIVPDGASAVYGSDAVGGVVNVMLKRDFDGVTVGMRYGGATDGGLITREYSATAGSNWATGGLIATWKKAENDPVYSDQRDYTQSMYRPSTLWPKNDLRSGLLSLHQAFGDAVELRLDALTSERRLLTYSSYSSIYYRYFPTTKSNFVAPSLEIDLPNDWKLTLGAAWGKDKTSYYQQTINAATSAGPSTSVGAYSNKSLTYELGGEGRLFTLPGGDARLAVGAGYRYNDFLYASISGNVTQAEGDESSRFVYAELNLPLVAPGQGVRGVERLSLTGAVRTEDYRAYGRVTTPKLGVVYSPTADFTLKTSWGKSFKAPTLMQRYWIQSAYYYTPETFGATGYPADATVVYQSGGNADLRPERARTLSASVAFHPEAIPGLESELTWFDIDYSERIVQPVANASQAMSSSIYSEFLDYDPAEATLAEVLANSSNFYNYTGVAYDASRVVAIVDNRYINAARQRVRGIDLSGTYRFDLGVGRMALRGSVSWLDSEQATTSTSGYSDMAGILFYPAKLNGRLGAVWSNGGFIASAFGNYRSRVENTADHTEGASFITFDGTLRYDTGERQDALANMVFEFSAQNLLNRAPPLHTVTALSNAPYDSTNYSAVGRFLSLSVSKHW
ncbi:TonB-dependent Receptor Plug domain protein [Xanthomonas citri pv. mangiferaeindicae LMG 941]|uniref:TonB-dependent receptor plug domain-containing protein n=1 Tax=Xanthomonas citri TaxID=346 RepID=UPI0002552978|nr:TonB-dependent receptor [Xanthomonas citri]CCG37613.1 TonB-dependent Receptor Plug domain protein [Xanthomonas citri pv. mangiferaeindicae LMG 941]